MVDLKKYTNQILFDEDRPLFDDAVKAAKVNALRATYVMIWLACAESLKRRFREAQRRDGAAGTIVGQIETKEKEHKSVDKFVLDRAYEYGFLSDAGHTVLNHVYEMRCIYGHPYEEAPSEEEVFFAAAVVVEHVLSKLVKLHYGFGGQLLKSLLEDPSYLDDQETAVQSFAKDIIPKIDENIHGWLLDKFWSKLETFADDSSMAIFFHRGIWFSQAFLVSIGVDLFTEDDWHNRVSHYPKTLVHVFNQAPLFKSVGHRAQDSLVGAILNQVESRASILKYLESLNDDNALSKRHIERFDKCINGLNKSSLRAAGLSTRTCFDRLVSAMQSQNWHIQNPAIDLFVANGPEQASELNEDQQIELGRNILQAGEGSAGSANKFLNKLAENGNFWPLNVARGIALELFTNESNQIRFKKTHLQKVCDALGDLEAGNRNKITSEIVISINVGTPKQLVDRGDFNSVVKVITQYSWGKKLAQCLEAKTETLPDEEDEDES